MASCSHCGKEIKTQAVVCKWCKRDLQPGTTQLSKADRIQAQAKRLPNASTLLARKEFRELPSVLWDDEDVEDMVIGFYDRADSVNPADVSGGMGVLVRTNRRLVFVDKGMFYGLKVEDFPLDKISSIQYEIGMLHGKITIFTSGNKAVISCVDKSSVGPFAEGVRVKIATTTAKPPVADVYRTRFPGHTFVLCRLA